MSYGMLIDTTRCIGCEACMDACHEVHNQPDNENYELSATNFTVVKTKAVNDEEIYFRQMCMHCESPSCVSVCPVGALEKTKEGPVTYDPSKCMGCRYCMFACPFDVPKYEWDSRQPLVQKCDMCYGRIKEGKLPACAEACEEGATVFGERDELIGIARRRMQQDPDSYHPYIYGVTEAGGTSVLVLAAFPLDQIGFKSKNFQQAFPKLTWEVMKEVPNVVSFSGVFMYGLWWIINRRMTLQKIQVEENQAVAEEEA